MEVRAVTKFVKVQPRKVRIVADEVRGKSAVYTAHQLRFHPSKAAFHLRKTLISAIHNAVNNHGLPVEELKITRIMIDEGPKQKRIQQRAMGRAYRILKKTSHITVIVDQQEAEAPIRAHGTRPKARPTFAAEKKKAGGTKKTKAEESVTEMEATAIEPEATVTEPEEATPVTASESPEEAGSVSPEETPQAEGESGETTEEKGDE